MRPFEVDSKAWMIINHEVKEGRITGISTYTYKDWVTDEYYTFEYDGKDCLLNDCKRHKRPSMTNLGATLFTTEEDAIKELEYQNKCEEEYYS